MVLRSTGLVLLHGLRRSKKVYKYARNGTVPLVLSIPGYLRLVCVLDFREFENSKKTLVVVFFIKLVSKS